MHPAPAQTCLTRRGLGAMVLGGLATAGLAACGSTESAQPAGSASGANGTTSGAISVTDYSGKTITLDAPAIKVVTLEWMNTEDVVHLGVQPVGVADPKGYASWVSSAPLTRSPTDVGLRTEPSLEAVAKVEPDLILGVEGSVPADAIAQMTKIAPVVLLKGADAADQVALMRANFATTAKLLGREPEATAKLAELDQAIAETKAKLAGRTADPFVLTYPNATGNNVDFRMHSPRSLPGALAALVGLTNAWPGSGDAAYGIGSLDLEAFTKFPATTEILYWANSSGDAVKSVLSKNAIWNSLPSVKNQLVKPVAKGVWLYGGPASAVQWLANLTKTFA